MAAVISIVNISEYAYNTTLNVTSEQHGVHIFNGNYRVNIFKVIYLGPYDETKIYFNISTLVT